MWWAGLQVYWLGLWVIWLFGCSRLLAYFLDTSNDELGWRSLAATVAFTILATVVFSGWVFSDLFAPARLWYQLASPILSALCCYIMAFHVYKLEGALEATLNDERGTRQLWVIRVSAGLVGMAMVAAASGLIRSSASQLGIAQYRESPQMESMVAIVVETEARRLSRKTRCQELLYNEIDALGSSVVEFEDHGIWPFSWTTLRSGEATIDAIDVERKHSKAAFTAVELYVTRLSLAEMPWDCFLDVQRHPDSIRKEELLSIARGSLSNREAVLDMARTAPAKMTLYAFSGTLNTVAIPGLELEASNRAATVVDFTTTWLANLLGVGGFFWLALRPVPRENAPQP